MAQKPMLRAEVYAHAMRASQNRNKEVRGEKEIKFGSLKDSEPGQNKVRVLKN